MFLAFRCAVADATPTIDAPGGAVVDGFFTGNGGAFALERRGTTVDDAEGRRPSRGLAAAVAADDVAHLEAREVVRLWRDVLDKLATDPRSLVGVLDWPTKQALLETAGRGLSADSRQKIALRYHALGAGGFHELEREGVIVRLVDDEEIEQAIHDAPPSSPASLRGRLVKEMAGRLDVAVDWASVSVGKGRLAKVIRLADHRR